MHYMQNALQHVTPKVVDGQLIPCGMLDARVWRVVSRRRTWCVGGDDSDNEQTRSSLR